MEKEEYGLTPGVLGLFALLSIGGLLFVGWQASLVGNAVGVPYSSCCNVEPWGQSQSGYRQGTGMISTELCHASELPQRCCIRAGQERYNSPVRLLDSAQGSCPAPEVSYPYGEGGFGNACCTVQKWQSAPTGFIQGEPVTTTESCSFTDTPDDCCTRAAAARYSYPTRFKVAGASPGPCTRPEKNYPTPIPGGYAACCTGETWQNAPTGYAQGTAETATAYCDPLETLSQCCIRSSVQNADHPIRLLGFKLGACGSPEINYPRWIR